MPGFFAASLCFLNLGQRKTRKIPHRAPELIEVNKKFQEEQTDSTVSRSDSLLDSKIVEEDSEMQSFDENSEASELSQTEPIDIPGPGHRRSYERIALKKYRSTLVYLKDCSEVDMERNEFDEAMPRVPEAIRPPPRAMRHRTKAPAASRWNPITDCWMDTEHDSSRGTWGCFKDKRRLHKLDRQLGDDEYEYRGLFRCEDPCISTANTKSDECRVAQAPELAPEHFQQSDQTEEKASRGARSSKRLLLEELRRLAAENESAIESYRSPVAEHVIRISTLATNSSARP